jgi:5'-nucleotidase
MLALVTNDDGIDAAGLRALLAAGRAAGLDLCVAAPNEESSGASASLSAVGDEGEVLVRPRRLDDVDAVAVGASPAFIVFMACQGAFGPPPDLVLSGVNHGPNLGHAVSHSGTVGAAITGALHGRRGLAVSTDVGPAWDWEAITKVATRAVEALLACPDRTVLNVNVPAAGAPHGFRRADLATFGAVQATVAGRGDEYVRLDVDPMVGDAEPGTDVALLAEGWATVTPLRPIGDPGDPVVDRVVDEQLA